MKSIKICVSSCAPVGGTFLDWSIHFLSGQNDFFSTTFGWIPLIKNPLTKSNAHGHLKNHPSGLHKTKNVIALLQAQNKLTSFYPINWDITQIATHLNINAKTMSPEQWKSIQDYQLNDYNQLLQESYSQGAKVIFISLNENLPLYTKSARLLHRMLFEDRRPESLEDQRKEYDQIFFKDSKVQLTNIWDIRERRALASNVIKYTPAKVDLSFKHYWLDAQNLWYNGEREIEKIMQWTELPMISERFDTWKTIYHDWQKIQIDAVQFQYNYKHIVESIVNNWSYPIDLTFDQEVVIQHCLIYQYGVNLKTWQLEKFPNNTKELHKLLEPNIHPLGDLY